ncbi:NAD(+) synthase [Chloroflexota bacterium]
MDTHQMGDKLAQWIEEKVSAAGLDGAVFGMSGGIDSSVVAALCKSVFKENLLGLIMPCHSNPQDEQHALAVADKFSIPIKKIELDAVYDNLLNLYSDGEEASHLAKANLKARLRMLTLYFHANQLGYMVTGSGNKSELTVGYFTKYGDGGVDILPLGNLVKQQVRQLAASLGIPQAIIDKPPSAGLWHGQTDEAEMGCSYKELDSYITSGETSAENKLKIEKMTAASYHKLNLPPIPEF